MAAVTQAAGIPAVWAEVTDPAAVWAADIPAEDITAEAWAAAPGPADQAARADPADRAARADPADRAVPEDPAA